MTGDKRIHVLCAKISEELPGDVYRRSLLFLPDELREKHFKYRRWQDRAANLYSKILLIRGLKKFGFDHRVLENLQYTEHGRPHLRGIVDFNISHSGEYVLCAVAYETTVGIDIEEIKPVDFADFTELMSEDQWRMIHTSPDPLKTFFTFWAIKESIIKADGRGLAIPLNDIIITKGTAFYETHWFLQELKIDEGYCASLASNRQDALLNVELVDLAGL